MRKIALILFVFLVGCASTPFCKPFEGWTTSDTYRQVAYTGLHIMDAIQTVQIAKSDRKYHEQDIASIGIGRYPEERDVYVWFAATYAAQLLTTSVIDKKYRPYWQWFWIGAETKTVSCNFAIGLHGDF